MEGVFPFISVKKNKKKSRKIQKFSQMQFFRRFFVPCLEPTVSDDIVEHRVRLVGIISKEIGIIGSSGNSGLDGEFPKSIDVLTHFSG